MIRWITERLGTCAYDDRPDEGFYLLDVRHLVDKGGNAAAAIAESIAAGADALTAGRSVIVACDFGVSRSNAIAAGILSMSENCAFDAALARVIAATGESEIKLDMVQSVRQALSAEIASVASGTILVTGGNGFLGRALVPQLRTAHRVVAPSRETLDLKDGAVKLAGYCRAEGVSQIVHLAYPRLYTNVAAMAEGLAMLRTVLETCKLLDIRLVFISGWVVFAGYTADDIRADEPLPLRPKGVYSDAKYLEERLVEAYARRGEIRHSLCRLSPVYGPGSNRPRLIKTFYEAIAAGTIIRTHRYLNGRPKLDLLYVDDAADAIARSVNHSDNEIFHFGSGKVHSTAEIADMIAKLANRDLQREEIAIEDHVANVAMDFAKARRLLGWQPRMELRDGLSLCLGLRN